MTFSILPDGYVRLNYIASLLDPITDEYVVHISTHTIGRIGIGIGGVVDALSPLQLRPGGEFFFEFDTDTGMIRIRADTVYSLIVDRFGDVPVTDAVQTDAVQSHVVPPEQPTPTNLSRGWIIGRVCDDEIDTVSIVYSDECDADREIVNFATLQPDATYVKMEIKAYVKAKVEAVWS